MAFGQIVTLKMTLHVVWFHVWYQIYTSSGSCGIQILTLKNEPITQLAQKRFKNILKTFC